MEPPRLSTTQDGTFELTIGDRWAGELTAEGVHAVLHNEAFRLQMRRAVRCVAQQTRTEESNGVVTE